MLNVYKDQEILVLSPEGEFTVARSQQLREGILDAMKDDEVMVLVFNLLQINFIDSAGMGILIASRNSLFKRGGRIILCNIPTQVKRIFAMTDFLDFFNLADNLDEAILLAKSWRKP